MERGCLPLNNQEVGEMIRTMRLSRNMTQEQLAEAIGKSPSAITMYESGRRRPKADVVEALADVFNVPKWAILYRESEMEPVPNVTGDDTRTRKYRMLSAGALLLSDEQLDKLYDMAHLLHPEQFPELPK